MNIKTTLQNLKSKIFKNSKNNHKVTKYSKFIIYIDTDSIISFSVKKENLYIIYNKLSKIKSEPISLTELLTCFSSSAYSVTSAEGQKIRCSHKYTNFLSKDLLINNLENRKTKISFVLSSPNLRDISILSNIIIEFINRYTTYQDSFIWLKYDMVEYLKPKTFDEIIKGDNFSDFKFILPKYDICIKESLNLNKLYNKYNLNVEPKENISDIEIPYLSNIIDKTVISMTPSSWFGAEMHYYLVLYLDDKYELNTYIFINSSTKSIKLIELSLINILRYLKEVSQYYKPSFNNNPDTAEVYEFVNYLLTKSNISLGQSNEADFSKKFLKAYKIRRNELQ